MDTLRGNFSAIGDDRDYDAGEDDTGHEAPPAAIGTDERRMQVRAYNHWASLLEHRNFPSIDDLDPDSLPDFGPYSVLLDFTAGMENPGVTYLGAKLAEECDITGASLQTLSDVPTRSLLSRITDHYMQILANQAPIGFEAEFVNQRGATILYRGILLPYSTDDEKIDFIYGVINWKELADQHTSDELLLQVDQALEQRPVSAPARIDDTPMTDWADGPGASVANDIDEAPGTEAGEDGPAAGRADLSSLLGATAYDDDEDDDDGGPIDYAAKYNLRYDDEEAEGDEDEERGSLPRPSFGSLTSIGSGLRKSERTAVLPEVPAASRSFPEIDLEDVHADLEDLAPATDAADLGADGLPDAALPADPEDMGLGDWLASARELAAAARTSEDRTRNALYDAIGRAYDFSLAAAEMPEDFEELVEDAGLTVQDRAPMTPVVKLVFGADYDKTRLTEYAAALSHGHRLGLPRGAFGDFLRSAEGGLKGVVAAERRLRKAESGKADEDPRERLAAKLRELPAIDLADLDPSGSEFGLVVIRRDASDGVQLLGEVPEDTGLLERAARKLIG